MTSQTESVTHRGGCHCGAVRFEVDAPAALDVTYCNCSVCRMTGYLHLIVRESAFRLLTERSDIHTYTFNTGVAQHYFCRHCGIKSFYIPRSNPDGVSVNVRCLDPGSVTSVAVQEFDGENWEAHADTLRHLTE